jgi:hypothetical protein
MKLVFVLLVMVNDVPQDPILFMDVKMCNTVAIVTEQGVASDSIAHKSQGNRIEAYCVPRMVEKDRTAVSSNKK